MEFPGSPPECRRLAHGRRVRWPGCALILLLALPGVGARAAGGFEAQFSMNALGGTVGEVTWMLDVEPGAGMTLGTRSGTAGLAALVRNVEEDERSTLRWHDGVLRPVHYRYERRGDKRARVVEIALAWDESKAHGTGRGGAWELPVLPGTVDELSVQLALIADLRAGLKEFSYPVIDDGSLENMAFRVSGSEHLDTRIGELETVRVERLRDDGRATTYWFASKLGYMPVRILHKERDGWSVEMRIESLSGQPPEALRFR